MNIPDSSPRGIQNLFSLNDWPIKKFLFLVLFLQIAVIGIVNCEEYGVYLPILRQVIVAIYLFFIPGFLILRVIRIHTLGNSISILLSLGLSILFIMLTGFGLNFLGPIVGISQPISETPILLVLSIGVTILSILALIRDYDCGKPVKIDVNYIFSTPVIFLSLLPLLAIIGTYFVNSEGNPVLLLILIVVIAILILFSGIFRGIPQEILPFMILSISMALLFHISLIDLFITGQDIHTEYFFSKLVVSQGYWNPAIEGNVNAMLSITILNPILSLLLNLDVGWVYKIVYPFLFAFLPLGLYVIYLRQFGEVPENNKIDTPIMEQKIPRNFSQSNLAKSLDPRGSVMNLKELISYREVHKILGPVLAFLAVMLFISYSTFFTEMISLARQQVAELFLMLFLLLMVTTEIPSPKRNSLGILFIFGLIVSHYTLSFIFLGILILTWIILYLSVIISNEKKTSSLISLRLIGYFLIINILWHFFIPGSTLFRDITEKLQGLVENFSSTFFQVQKSQPVFLITQGITSPLHSIYKVLFGILLILILIGIIAIVMHLLFRSMNQDAPFSKEYRALALSNFLLLMSVFLIPSLNIFGISRIVHIVLIVLAPVAILAGIVILKFFNRISQSYIIWNPIIWKKIISVFFSVFIALLFLFGTGFFYELAKDNPASIAISQKSIVGSEDLRAINQFYNIITPEGDIFGVRWISKHRESGYNIYAGLTQVTMPFKSYGMIPNVSILRNDNNPSDYYLPPKSYLFLGILNNKYSIISDPFTSGKYWDARNITPTLEKKSQIYSDGDATVFV